MTFRPWWAERVASLLETPAPSELELGQLWALSERFAFVQENVELGDLLEDFRQRPELELPWQTFQTRAANLHAALHTSREGVAARLRSGALGPQLFRQTWETLGYEETPHRVSTAADDWLDGLLAMTRLTTGHGRPPFGQVNLSSRAQRISDFLHVADLGPNDTVYDLGCGSGKLALTVAASSCSQVKGVEYGLSYVESARDNALRLGLSNFEVIHSDVRDVDLSNGTVFYLYYPFWGEVAEAMAAALGRAARARPITVYLAGPRHQFGDYFLAQVEQAALCLSDIRGESSEVLVFRSAPLSPTPIDAAPRGR